MNERPRNSLLTTRPVSTYRLQLHAGFGFGDARRALGYLDNLGISDIYSSPYLQAFHGSTHGYDVVNPGKLNDELGSLDDFRAFSDEMSARGMGHVLDVVPNHMGIVDGNPWWWDVLESGPSSRYAAYFDIDWSPPKESLKDKVLLPTLGGQFSEILERGELKLERKAHRFALTYYQHRFPLAPRTLPPILLEAEQRLAVPEVDPARQELRSIARALRLVSERQADNRSARLERADELSAIGVRLGDLLEKNPQIGGALDAVLLEWSGVKGEPSSFDRLEKLISEQHYRLADWHVAAEEINYRRFFDVNQLAAIRTEDEQVFEDVHAFIFKLLAEGRARGLRLDHTDGLRDPLQYFRRLRAHIHRGDRLYAVAEKILATGEQLPSGWPIQGTTGYDYMTALTGISVDMRGEAALTQLYQDFTGDPRGYPEHSTESRRLVMRASLQGEVHTLARQLEHLAGLGRRPHDFTNASLRRAITETIAAFPVYRTYLRAEGETTPEDRKVIETTIAAARARNPDLDGAHFDYLQEVLLLAPLPGTDDAVRAKQVEFVLRFQQLTPPMMAKGVEDTAFYTYRRFLALNDVGGDPGRFGTSTEEFHEQNRLRRERWPLSMLGSSTHDSKRGEDVRARLAVLSEIPEAWADRVHEWSALCRGFKTDVGEQTFPTTSDEYLFFQTVLGAFPFDGELNGDWIERMAGYHLKAVREAKEHTSWMKNDKPYEDAVDKYVRRALAHPPFRESLSAFAREIIPAGVVNSLAQVALKLCSPGVADTYQGSEDWNLSLVDPDNRRPVHYRELAGRLGKLQSAMKRDRAALCSDVLARAADGDAKLYATHVLLRARREDEALFLDGDYQPLEAGEHLVAFARTLRGRTLLCVVPRCVHAMMPGGALPLGDAWQGSLPNPTDARLRDLFTGREISGSTLRLSELFASFPAAVLISE